MGVSFATLTRDNAPALEAVLPEVWAHHWRDEFARKVVEWRYWSRPAGGTRLALDGGRCVGLIDCFVRPYIVAGRTVLVRESCDWWAEPEHRPAGLGLRLMRQLMATGDPIVSIGGSAVNCALLPRLGWRWLGDVERWILPLTARDSVAMLLRRRRREGLARLVPRRIPIRRLRATPPPSMDARVREWRPGDGAPGPPPDGGGLASLVQEADLHWLAAAPPELLEIESLTYSVGGEPCGFAVTQLEPTPAGGEGKIVHLQVARESAELLGWMVTEAVRRLAGRGAGIVRARSASPVLATALRSAGFLAIRREPVYWWGPDSPPQGAPLYLSYLRADDAIPFAAARG